jgi:hypothetical protein
MARPRIFYWLAVSAVAAPAAWLSYTLTSAPRPPTIDEYIAARGSAAARADAAFLIGGRKPFCGELPVVTDTSLDDVAAAHPGYIIVNPKRLAMLPDAIAAYAYAHECGHQVEGASEEKADCYAVSRGRRDGWLTPAGIAAICDFWRPYAGDNAHLPGLARCELMQRCFADAKG